jgi:putative DNA methylase
MDCAQETMSHAPRRKLIEVALPLEKINAEAAREKSIRHGHPSTLHLWWARRPLAAARAVLFAQLVDDPSSLPGVFPTEEDQKRERARLHAILEELVVWENIRDERVLNAARAEIMRSTGGNPPPILDPFAGGGSIPLEAQRLGLEAHASDLNPVAVLINKALIEIPPKFAGRGPVFPGLAEGQIHTWSGAEGLAADVRAYGEWMRDRALERIGHLYPKATLPDGSKATVIAWIWARTVTCPNPACGIEMPLVRSWWLGKKTGRKAYVVPGAVDDATHPSGKRVTFGIGHDASKAPTPETDGTVGRAGAVCVSCSAPVELTYMRAEGRAGRMGSQLMAVVAERPRRREVHPPAAVHVDATDVARPVDVPDGEVAVNPRWFSTPAFGMTHFADLFTNRQLVALTTFSDLVSEAREQVLAAAMADGWPAGARLERGGSGAEAYADAVATYLGMGVSRLADIANALCRWENTREQVRNLFARQAIPMVWDFAEPPPFGPAAGSFTVSLGNLAKSIAVSGKTPGRAIQTDASTRPLAGLLISTDPPYYDNIGYSDLSDFFYVWLRRSLQDVHPQLLATMLVPKEEELVANPYRHGGKAEAQEFFESGFAQVFARARATALPDYPITVFYAFKQAESTKDGEASTGWETLLEGMVRSRWAITATWPMRSELSNRMLGQGTNALASSIVLALRPRPDDAPTTDRRSFIAALKDELPTALRELQQGRIAPVDLPQAAIGPGMAVFSRYSGIIERDGSTMRVRDALARINEVLDEMLAEQEGDFDADTRFAIAWFRGHGYTSGLYGDADSLARARNADLDSLERGGILTKGGGKVALIRPAGTPPDYDPGSDERISHWEVVHHLVRLLGDVGIGPAGRFLAKAQARTDGAIDADLAKELAFLLFAIAEDRKMTADAVAFNALGTAWPDVVAVPGSASPATSRVRSTTTTSRRSCEVEAHRPRRTASLNSRCARWIRGSSSK